MSGEWKRTWTVVFARDAARGQSDRGSVLTCSCSQLVLGTVLLWVGWLGFNGGSCFAASLKAALAIFNTNLAGSVG
jgi:Amt family ammonium transporter